MPAFCGPVGGGASRLALTLRLPARDSRQQVLRLGVERAVGDLHAGRPHGKLLRRVPLVPTQQAVSLLHQVAGALLAIDFAVLVQIRQLFIVMKGGLDLVGGVVGRLVVHAHPPGLLDQRGGAADVAKGQGQAGRPQGAVMGISGGGIGRCHRAGGVAARRTRHANVVLARLHDPIGRSRSDGRNGGRAYPRGTISRAGAIGLRQWSDQLFRVRKAR